ncbi:MAG TPA: ABC transporter permease [Cyanobacteria bacterium UBA8530]|nr:ABC transporter permease [Cyanobacteria bacterium UBA8530]
MNEKKILFLEEVGKGPLNLLEAFGEPILLAAKAFGSILRGKIHRGNALSQLSLIGVDSFPIALLTALSVGMVFTMQVASEFIRFGATSAIGGVAAIAIARELAPLLTGVVVAGRVGAAIAAELGSMKVTEQIDALKVMATDPVDFLVAPRVLACVTMLPLLTLLANIIGIFGGGMVAVALKGVSPQLFFDSVQQLLTAGDVFRGLIKAACFGAIIAVVGCQKGLATSNGAQGVGRSTTDAVVISLITIFVSNYFLSSLLYPGSSLK